MLAVRCCSFNWGLRDGVALGAELWWEHVREFGVLAARAQEQQWGACVRACVVNAVAAQCGCALANVARVARVTQTRKEKGPMAKFLQRRAAEQRRAAAKRAAAKERQRRAILHGRKLAPEQV